MKKKIGIIIPDLRCGGAEKVYIDLANYWVLNEIEISFIVMNNSGDFLNRLDSRINVINLRVKRIRNLLIPLSKIIRSSSFTHIISVMWPINSIAVFSWLLALCKTKIFLTEHIALSKSLGTDFKFNKLLLKLSISITYPFANGVIGVSNGVISNIKKLSFLKNINFKTIYNPASKVFFNDQEIKKTDLWKKNVFKILSVGTLKKQKDHKNLILALSLLPKDFKFHAIIIGEGVERNNLEKLIDEKNLTDQIFLVGYIPKVKQYYETADLFVLSSKYEGFGNVLVEALETGLNIVSTNCESGPSEILENGIYGNLVEPENPTLLAKSIQSAKKNKLDKNFLKKRANKFAIDKIANQYLNYLDE